MAGVTAFMALASFLAGTITAVLGYRAGHGEASLSTVMTWAAGTLLLQAFTAFVAAIHGRAHRAELAALYEEIDRLGEGRLAGGAGDAGSAKASTP